MGSRRGRICSTGGRDRRGPSSLRDREPKASWCHQSLVAQGFQAAVRHAWERTTCHLACLANGCSSTHVQPRATRDGRVRSRQREGSRRSWRALARSWVRCSAVLERTRIAREVSEHANPPERRSGSSLVILARSCPRELLRPRHQRRDDTGAAAWQNDSESDGTQHEKIHG